MPELRDECRRRGVRNYRKLRKAELINLLKGMPDIWACRSIVLLLHCRPLPAFSKTAGAALLPASCSVWRSGYTDLMRAR